MERETYSIDEILEEAKKRRQEKSSVNNEENEPDVKETEKPNEDKFEPDDFEENAEKEQVEFEIQQEPEKEEVEFVLENEPKDISQEPDEIIEIVEDTVDDEEIIQTEDDAEEEISLDEAFDRFSAVKEEKIREKPEKKKKKPKKKTNKLFKILIIILAVLVLGLVVGAGVYVHNALDSVTSGQTDGEHENQWKGMDTLVESFPAIEETDASELSSLKDMIKTWYMNGEPCSSSHVLNVLLIGEDTRGSEILDTDTRADSAIIVSINIDTQTITMTSVLRDAFAYWQSTQGDEETGQYGKINGAMAVENCNIDTYIGCLESLYKVDIDNYVIVNFDSFEKIIDVMGGVTLEMTQYEIYEINNHPKRYGNVYIEKTFDGESGKIKLTGEQALAYCRIRKLDSDNARADRQKTCLTEIFNQAKDSSKAELLKIINALVPYVKTGFSAKEIVSIARYGFSNGWLGYDVRMTTVPYARINENGAGGIYYGAWCWKADYPADAYYLQMLMYGKSSITLARTRVDILNCPEEGYYKDGYSSVWATISNENYGVPTTFEELTKEETTASN